MATVDNGIIVRTEHPWIRVKPRCPHCGHVESDWSLVSMGIPQMAYSKTTHGHTCSKCRKSYVITAYPG